MISMKWRADSENSENSALDTIIVSHKIYGKKLFFHRFDFTSSDSPLKQPTGTVHQVQRQEHGVELSISRYAPLARNLCLSIGVAKSKNPTFGLEDDF